MVNLRRLHREVWLSFLRQVCDKCDCLGCGKKQMGEEGGTQLPSSLGCWAFLPLIVKVRCYFAVVCRHRS